MISKSTPGTTQFISEALYDSTSYRSTGNLVLIIAYGCFVTEVTFYHAKHILPDFSSICFMRICFLEHVSILDKIM